MAPENNKRLQAALSTSLKADGFRKSGATWRKHFVESIGVLNIQGSQWGPSFYINLGVYFRPLGKSEAPNEYDCHIRCRLDDLVPNRHRLVEILDFDQDLDLSVRARELEVAVLQHGIPWLERCSTTAGAADYASTLPATSAWVTKEAREFLRAAR